MSSLSALGAVHTVISLVAVGAGIACFIRDGRIDAHTRHGRLYVAMTASTCLTGFFIFSHGHFGKPHVLGVITLAVLALALVAERGLVFGRVAARTATIAFSLTFYFHLIPAVTETSTRLPVHAPLVASADSPVLAVVFGLMFVLFLFGVRMQLRRPGGRAGKRDVQCYRGWPP